MNRSSQFSRARVFTVAAVVAALVALTAAFTIGWASAGQGLNGPDASQADSGHADTQADASPTDSNDTDSSHTKPSHTDSIEAVAEELARGQARDQAKLNANLAEAAEEAHGRLGRVLQELTGALSAQAAGGTPPGADGADGAAKWIDELGLAVSVLESVEEGTSEQTVARESFIGAAHLLEAAARDYEHFAGASGNERLALAESAIKRRDAAVRLWQAGAGQLGTLTVESGEGHVHLFLAPDGDPDAVPQEFREPAEPRH